MPGADYAAFVTRFCDRWEAVTGRTVFYEDGIHAIGYCPSCKDGTVRVTFRDGSEPKAFIASYRGGRGHCSGGCTEAEIAEALR
jgi:hypothetical protein